MSKRSILVILLILMPLSLLLSSDFIIESDGRGNTLLVEYFGYDRHVEIPDGVNIIGEWAFDSSYFLQSIHIPDSVTTIEMGAFNHCSSLKSLLIPRSVTLIEDGAFFECFSLREIIVAPDNPHYASVDGILFDKERESLLLFPLGKDDTTYSIPKGTTTVGMGAFANNYSLENIIIPNSVLSISDAAFFACSDLEEINIPDSVIFIGEMAFSECSSLESVFIPASVTYIGEEAFRRCTDLEEIRVSPANPKYASIQGV
ncbi:MAG: leucine-rich repeat domain-containing protein, partial [Spirochaetales bacterium]|nr:leucine-rich repeat domain-containing protein [Spirochaetales bacterium]